MGFLLRKIFLKKMTKYIEKEKTVRYNYTRRTKEEVL